MKSDIWVSFFEICDEVYQGKHMSSCATTDEKKFFHERIEKERKWLYFFCPLWKLFMIINVHAKKILCFGDSLTWGNHFDGHRFPLEQRWTFMLQEHLWEEFDIIEEWLRARTTNMEDPARPGRNGFSYFPPCFESLGGVDCLILFLGTNDVKKKFHLSWVDILKNIELYLDFVSQYDKDNSRDPTKVILVTPPQINKEYLAADSSFDQASENSLAQLALLEEELSSRNGYTCVNLYGQIIWNKRDGVHLEFEDNQVISNLLFQAIHTIFI